MLLILQNHAAGLHVLSVRFPNKYKDVAIEMILSFLALKVKHLHQKFEMLLMFCVKSKIINVLIENISKGNVDWHVVRFKTSYLHTKLTCWLFTMRYLLCQVGREAHP